MARQANLALATQLRFSPPTRDLHGNLFGFCQGPVSGRLLIQLSEKGLVVPFGVSAWENQRSTMTLCVPADATDLREFLAAMDEKVKTWAWENRQQIWHDPPATKELLDSHHKPLLRKAKESSFKDTLQLRVSADAQYWNTDKTKGDAFSVVKGGPVIALASASRLWTTSQASRCYDFGLTLTMHHTLVLPAPAQDPAALFSSVSFE